MQLLPSLNKCGVIMPLDFDGAFLGFSAMGRVKLLR